MQIQVDTREHAKEWARIREQFDNLGVKYFKSKLYVGDFMSLDNPRLVIDRKKDLLEICGNICQQHERFRAELARAKENGIQMIILCEHGDGIHDLEDVKAWVNPRYSPWMKKLRYAHPKYMYLDNDAFLGAIRRDGVPYRQTMPPTNGEQLYKSMVTISQNYGVKWMFCEKAETGKKIIELLRG